VSARYVDGIKVAVQLVGAPFDSEPDEIWVCEVLVGGALDDPQAIVSEMNRSLDRKENTPPYTLDDTYRIFNWGAPYCSSLESALTSQSVLRGTDLF
jgi:hypothetical protein